MKSLFEKSASDEMIARINKLTPAAQPLWGKMNAAQALAHLSISLRAASGEDTYKKGLLGILFGGLAKKAAFGEKPFRHNVPTDKKYVVSDERDLGVERKNLIAAVQKFSQAGPAGITKCPHPFFGVLTVQEWDILMWKHLDHHLRQFGV